MTTETISHDEFLARCEAQGVEPRHWAFKCPMCGTVQSPESLFRAGLKQKDMDSYLAFSCVGRFTGAGEHKTGTPPGKGCNWTLGGLLRIHNLQVRFGEGEPRYCFDIASKEEAEALRAKHQAEPAPEKAA